MSTLQGGFDRILYQSMEGLVESCIFLYIYNLGGVAMDSAAGIMEESLRCFTMYQYSFHFCLWMFVAIMKAH